MINKFRAWRLLAAGQKLLRKGNAQDALNTIKTALTLAPSYAALHMHMALIHSKLGRHGQALDSASRAIELSPNNPAFHCLMGMMLIDSEHLDDAIQSLNRALDISAKYLAARAYRGLAHILQGNTEGGYADIMASRGFGLTSFEARLLYMCESSMMTHPDLARPIEDTIKEDESKPDCSETEVSKLVQGKFTAGATHPTLTLDTGMDCLLADKNFETALKLFEIYTEADLNSPHRQAVIGFVHQKLGNHKSSLKHFEIAVKADSTDFRIHYYMGLAHTALNNRRNAIKYFSDAIDQVNPGIAINRLDEFMRVEREINSA